MVGLFGAFGERRRGVETLPSMQWSKGEKSSTFTDDHVAVSSSFHPTDAADQPVQTTDGDVSVWVQGDIYGFERGGTYTPRPSTLDVPTYCANLYEAYGLDFADGLNGQFACVVYDRDTRNVHLVTDRLGSYPLFRTRSESGAVVCSTDIQKLPTYPGVDPSFDVDYLAEYIVFKRSFGVTTPLTGVEKLPPATVTTLDLDTMTTCSDRYWRPEYTPVDAPFRFFVDRFTDLFQQILGEWVRDDLDYGVLLSGGSDSRLIMAATDTPVVGFHMNDWPNREARTARQVADAAENEFVFLRRDESYRARALDRNPPLSNFDGWFTQAYPTGFADEIRDSVDVLLSGLYSDTLFKSHTISSPKVSLGRLGTVTLPVEKRVESVDDFIDELAVETPPYLDCDIESVLRENITTDGDAIDHHGVRYRSLRELVLCSDYYPLTNDTELIYTNSLRQLRPYRTPFLDNRLVDLHLSMPTRYRLRRNIVHRAIERLDAGLAAIPHSETGVPLDRSFPVEYVGKHLNALRWKFLDTEEPPEPWFTDGPWSDDAELIRQHGFVVEALAEHREIIDELPFLDWEGVKRCYGNHLDGQDNTVELYTLLTLLAMPVTSRVLDTCSTDEKLSDSSHSVQSLSATATGRSDSR